MVEVVRRLVEEEGLGLGEEDAGELPSRKGAQGLVENPLGQAEGRGHLRGLGAGGPSPGRRELLVEPDVALHRLRLARSLGRSHVALGFAYPPDGLVDAPHGEDAFAHGLGGVAFVGVLRKVADGSPPVDGAGRLDDAGRRAPARQKARQGGLARAVAPHKADAHSRIDAEGGVDDEFARADAHREVLGVNHPTSLRKPFARTRRPRCDLAPPRRLRDRRPPAGRRAFSGSRPVIEGPRAGRRGGSVLGCDTWPVRRRPARAHTLKPRA